jgi:hypothetical protein
MTIKHWTVDELEEQLRNGKRVNKSDRVHWRRGAKPDGRVDWFSEIIGNNISVGEYLKDRKQLGAYWPKNYW